MKNLFNFSLTFLLFALLVISFSRCANENPNEDEWLDTCYTDSITKIRIVNNSDTAIRVYLTLGTVSGCLQNISYVQFVTDSISQLVGSFMVRPHDSTIDYAPYDAGFNGNLSFGSQPLNCPNKAYPKGINIFEFMINNSFQSGNPQNTVDISCVAGINCYIKTYLTGGNNWNASSDYPDVDSIYNCALGCNSGLVGIYPYGCDACIGRNNPPSCVTSDSDKQKKPICNVQRNAIGSGGGLIRIVFEGNCY